MHVLIGATLTGFWAALLTIEWSGRYFAAFCIGFLAQTLLLTVYHIVNQR